MYHLCSQGQDQPSTPNPAFSPRFWRMEPQKVPGDWHAGLAQGSVHCGGQAGDFLANKGPDMLFIDSLLDSLFQDQHYFPFECARSLPVLWFFGSVLFCFFKYSFI